MAAVNGGADREEAILEDYKFNSSSNNFSPLTAQEQIQENQQPVSFIFMFFEKKLFIFLMFF